MAHGRRVRDAPNVEPRHAGNHGAADRRRPQRATAHRKRGVPALDDADDLIMGCPTTSSASMAERAALVRTQRRRRWFCNSLSSAARP